MTSPDTDQLEYLAKKLEKGFNFFGNVFFYLFDNKNCGIVYFHFNTPLIWVIFGKKLEHIKYGFARKWSQIVKIMMCLFY